VVAALLGLIAAELVAAVATALAYRRRLRLAGFVAAVTEADELVSKALLAARRAQIRELTLAQRAALLEETRSALDQAAAIMCGTPIPLQLALRRELPAATRPQPRPDGSRRGR
jgi:hypothetical protein